MTALTLPSLADTVRHHYHRAILSPASTVPSVRTTRVTTPADAGQVHEALSGSLNREINAHQVFKGFFKRSRGSEITTRKSDR